MQSLISHTNSLIVDNSYLQKVYNLHRLRVDYELLTMAFDENHAVAVFLDQTTRTSLFAGKLKSIDRVHATPEGSPIITFGELLMYVHATRLGEVDTIQYFEIIANPTMVESYADLYGHLTPNWIFRVWSIEDKLITNRRNVVCKNLRDLDIFVGNS